MHFSFGHSSFGHSKCSYSMPTVERALNRVRRDVSCEVAPRWRHGNVGKLELSQY